MPGPQPYSEVADPADGDNPGVELSARERILAVAALLFAERGFDRTSTARIATLAAVPHGLIFYHFKTKMDLLLALVRDDRLDDLNDLIPVLPADTELPAAITAVWERLAAVLGRPTPLRRIIFQELAAHPEVSQRAAELHDRIAARVSRFLAAAGRHDGDPLPEHDTAARLLTIAASMAPLLSEPDRPVIEPATVGALIADGLARAGREQDTMTGARARPPAIRTQG